jgi:hypothetical protein
MMELYGDDWRTYVWVNRTDTMPLPKQLEYLEEFQWLVGPICSKGNIQVQEMRDASELELWKLDGGEAAQQHWTGHMRMLRLLDERCVDKIWIRGIASYRK